MVCSKCGLQLEDGVAFCPNCGSSTTGGPQPQQAQQPQQQVVYVNPADHTAEFTAQDIADNKLFATLPYLMSIIGVIITLLGAAESPYAKFHVRQALKIDVLNIMLVFISSVLSWTCIIPLAGIIAIITLLVVRIICLIQVFMGKAKEPVIVKEFKFL